MTIWYNNLELFQAHWNLLDVLYSDSLTRPELFVVAFPSRVRTDYANLNTYEKKQNKKICMYEN